MRFGKTLKESVYPPWKAQYLDYAKLKSLLREDGTASDDQPWTEDDESRFCEEILNVQLEKVAGFQSTTFHDLENRVASIGDKIRDMATDEDKPKGDITIGRYKEIEKELDNVTNETNELKKYSSINYTGFLKICKKHDRKRGNRYKIRPMLQISLANRPFNSEQGYSPLLNKLSAMYFVVRQNLEEPDKGSSTSETNGSSQNTERYTAYKFWVHPDNLLEVKTYILRRLPMLVYSQQSAKEVDPSQSDPTITSLYFDSPKFDLYTKKVAGPSAASSLRLRWYGQLSDKPEIFLEQKVILENESSEEKRFPIKDKFVSAYIAGEYKMEKSVQKLENKALPEEKVAEFKRMTSDIQEFILSNDLQPVLRANYTRSAFQKPLDDRVRISIDTKIAFIREDSLDSNRPCRNPENWHRTDIDNSRMEFPYSNVNKGEINRFPFAVLEIKVKEDNGRKTPQWIEDLMSSHLVHKAPRFSKFVHGVATLFDDYVNNLPFWLSDLETDIRMDPHTAFDEEEKAKAQRAEDEFFVGSYTGAGAGGRRRSSYRPAVSSPLSKSHLGERLAVESNQKSRAMSDIAENGKGKGKDTEPEGDSFLGSGYGTLRSVFPSFSLSRYAQSRRQQQEKTKLPPGVTDPGLLIKDSGPLQVEPKVWLANERTFLKWQHISILLGTLSISLYTAAGENFLAEVMGVAYIVIAVFAGAWGYYMHYTRRNMIVARSGKDFDNFVGPIIVSIALMVALLLNFVFKFSAALERLAGDDTNSTDFALIGESAIRFG